jgi:hypothetical protein
MVSAQGYLSACLHVLRVRRGRLGLILGCAILCVSCSYLPQFLSKVDDDKYLGNETADQSWDQANLKRNDRGCPTAIFVAPGGDLEQC